MLYWILAGVSQAAAQMSGRPVLMKLWYLAAIVQALIWFRAMWTRAGLRYAPFSMLVLIAFWGSIATGVLNDGPFWGRWESKVLVCSSIVLLAAVPVLMERVLNPLRFRAWKEASRGAPRSALEFLTGRSVPDLRSRGARAAG